METEEQLNRGKQLIAMHQARKVLEEAEHLLKVLPQGRGSTLDADLVDGLHAAEIIAKAVAKASEEIVKRVGRGGGGGLASHGDAHHTLTYALADKTRPSPWVAETDVPVLTDAKYPNALLRDGSRITTGHLPIGDGKKIRFWHTEQDCFFDVYLSVDAEDDVALCFMDEFETEMNLMGIGKLWAQDLRITSWESPEMYMIISTKAVNDAYCIFKNSQDGSPPTVAKMQYGMFSILRAGDITGVAGKTVDMPLYKVGGVAGVDGDFTTVDGKKVMVSKGLITSIV